MESFTWDDLKVLLAVHRHHSFLAAGRALGVSTSTVSRRIDALEKFAGRRLVHRTPEGATVEPEAAALVALADSLERGLSLERRDTARESPRLAGVVRISLGEGFIPVVTRALANLRRIHPEISIELISESRPVDLSRREADIGIRTVASHSASLLVRPAGKLGFGLYASVGYVDERLRDLRLRRGDFGRHDFIGLEEPLARLPQQRWLIDEGAARFPFRANSLPGQLAAANNGQGIAVIADDLSGELPLLRRLTLDVEPPGARVYVAMHRELRKVPRVLAVARALERISRAA